MRSRRSIAGLLAALLLAAACGGEQATVGGDGGGAAGDASTTTTVQPGGAEQTTTTGDSPGTTDDPPDTTAPGGTTGPDSTTNSETSTTTTGEGDYAVLLVSRVDQITADIYFDALGQAGLDAGFVLEGEESDGYDLYRPGLTEEEAEALLAEIRAGLEGLVDGASQAGLVWETSKLP